MARTLRYTFQAQRNVALKDGADLAHVCKALLLPPPPGSLRLLLSDQKKRNVGALI